MIRAALLGTVLVVAAPAAAQDSARETALFDGRTLNGWVLPSGADAANFSVRDGAIRVKGRSGWLHTDRSYTDFTLRAQVRCRPGP